MKTQTERFGAPNSVVAPCESCRRLRRMHRSKRSDTAAAQQKRRRTPPKGEPTNARTHRGLLRDVREGHGMTPTGKKYGNTTDAATSRWGEAKRRRKTNNQKADHDLDSQEAHKSGQDPMHAALWCVCVCGSTYREQQTKQMRTGSSDRQERMGVRGGGGERGTLNVIQHPRVRGKRSSGRHASRVLRSHRVVHQPHHTSGEEQKKKRRRNVLHH